ncbi:hypothetical protein NHQ30_003477 [Ciborinia camelliae]|nr:hypothetical protein NHQ30_003477 [Ciborinia camelliae]
MIWEERLQHLKSPGRGNSVPSVEQWWEENQLAVYDRKQRLLAEKREWENAQEQKQKMLRRAKGVTLFRDVSRGALLSDDAKQKEKSPKTDGGSVPLYAQRLQPKKSAKSSKK